MKEQEHRDYLKWKGLLPEHEDIHVQLVMDEGQDATVDEVNEMIDSVPKDTKDNYTIEYPNGW